MECQNAWEATRGVGLAWCGVLECLGGDNVSAYPYSYEIVSLSYTLHTIAEVREMSILWCSCKFYRTDVTSD